MDGSRFDSLTRAFAEPGTRRRLLGGLVAGALGALGLRGTEAATCRAPGSVCREDANCCSKVCGPTNATGRRVCACPSPTVACNGACVNPAAFQSDPANCNACGRRCPGAPCMSATCTGGTCGLTANPAANGRSCDDGNSCTTGSTCLNGACQGGTTVSSSLTCPANVSQGNDAGQCGAQVTYAAPSVICQTGAISCVPPSGPSSRSARRASPARW